MEFGTLVSKVYKHTCYIVGCQGTKRLYTFLKLNFKTVGGVKLCDILFYFRIFLFVLFRILLLILFFIIFSYLFLFLFLFHFKLYSFINVGKFNFLYQ